MRFSLKLGVSPVSQGNVSGLGIILLSFVALIVSIFIFKISGFIPIPDESILRDLNWWKQYPPKAHVERWVLATIAVVFALTSFLTMITGIIEFNSQKKTKSLKKRNPQSPWLWDYNWQEGRNLSRAKVSNGSHLFAASILIGFHIVAWSIALKEKFRGMIIIFPIGITLFTLLIAIIFFVIYRRNKAHQKVSLSIERFPLQLGTRATFHVHHVNSRKIKKIIVRLMAIKEVYSYQENQRAVQTQIEFEVEQEVTLTSDNFDISFDLPENSLSSALSERPASFWEFHLYAKCDGPDLDKKFLIPVY